MKKIVLFLLCFCIFYQVPVLAKPSYVTQLNKGVKLLNEQKYTPAIESYTKAVKLAPDNLEARASLAKAYITRANIYLNEEKEFGKAANDYRCALYYIQYFEPAITDAKLQKLNFEAENKLNKCYKKLHFKKNSETHLLIADLLKIAGIYPAALYEYHEASKDEELTKRCERSIKELAKKVP